MKVSRKKLVAIVGAILVAVMGISAFSSMTTFVPCRVTMYADPATNISLGQFKECACLTPFTSYDWDGVMEGETYECPVYVKNTGTVGLLIVYEPMDLFFFDDQAHFTITCFVLEFGMPCELYVLDTPVQLPEKDPTKCTEGFLLPPGKVIKVDIQLYIDRVVVGEHYTWEFTFWGKTPCEEAPPAKLILDKFNDTNGNGVYDAGDVKITDWPINVMDPHGGTSTYHAPKSLDITEFGTYTITEDLLAGWEQTAVQVDGVYMTPPTAQVKILINEGETHTVLYGNKKIPPLPAKLILDKFNDTNGNGIYDAGDIKIANWKIDVKDPDGITTTYLTPKTIDTTKFGTYTTTEELPADWEQTALRVDGAYLAPAVTTTVLISEGETHEVLYGNKLRPPPRAKLTIQKFNDTNNNGIYDPDPLITGWTVHVKDPDGITATYTTPVDLVITKFGIYTITEDLPSGWIQTAVYVDGALVTPPTLTVTVAINSGETHTILYGNFKIPPPPPIGIWMSIVPISQRSGLQIAFSWQVLTTRPDVIPQKIELRLVPPSGSPFIIHTATNFPTDYAGTYYWTATPPTGTWWIYITYTYTYYGTTYTAGTFGTFTVTS